MNAVFELEVNTCRKLFKDLVCLKLFRRTAPDTSCKMQVGVRVIALINNVYGH